MKTHDRRMGIAIQAMLHALESYSRAYKAAFDSPVGADAILGDDGVRDILRGINTLLNGPLGDHDGGTLSSEIYRIAREHGLTDENGEF